MIMQPMMLFNEKAKRNVLKQTELIGVIPFSVGLGPVKLGISGRLKYLDPTVANAFCPGACKG